MRSTTADPSRPAARAGGGPEVAKEPPALAHGGPEAPRGLPRLLAGIAGHGDATGLAQHRLVYPPPPRPARPREDFLVAVERSGLRGRGGAGFPTGTKLRAVRDGRSQPVVVVNGSEGEPASGKDELLLTMAPHLVLDGALLAAAAVGARQVVVCVDQSATAALGALERALAERGRAEGGPPVRLAAIPSRYVAGEETALVHWLNGGPATPTRTPPRVFQRGVGGHPTLVDNVETLAHLAQILRFGPDWFRQLGTADEPGSVLVTLSGAVDRPGVYEVPSGAALASLASGAGGPPEGIRAVLVGGFFGSWLSAAQASAARLSNTDLRGHGAGLGCGAIVVLEKGACGLQQTARMLAWLAGQTAGQCGPCVNGLAAVASVTAALHDGTAGSRAVDQLRRWAGQIQGRGACHLPDGAIRLLRSAFEVFADDIWHHLDGGGCPLGVRARETIPATGPTNGRLPWR
jgi:NADH:ubiquinone oxidoreductase subunit F (NADH-binding)